MKQGLAPTLKIAPHGHHLVKEEPVSSGDSLPFPGTSAAAYGSLFKKSPGHSHQNKNHIHLILTLFSFLLMYRTWISLYLS